MIETPFWVSCNDLFVSNKPTEKDDLKGCYCYKCIYAETTTKLFKLPKGFLHCKYYPRMICKVDDHCKAGIPKGNPDEIGKVSKIINSN